MIKVVLFSPHSHCEAWNGDPHTRDCDIRAKTSAEKLYAKLLSAGVASSNITYIKHNTLRSNYDLNRFPSRNTQPRKELRDAILELYDDNDVERIYLLEVHSFPEGWEVPIHGKKIVILNRPENAEIGKCLVDSMGGNSEGVYLYLGTEKCDIQAEFTPGRDVIVPYLIEINENSDIFPDSELDKKLTQIANFVAHDLAADTVENTLISENVVSTSIIPEFITNRSHAIIVAIIILILVIIVLLMFESYFTSTVHITAIAIIGSALITATFATIKN
jgi:hypothetical protein